MKYRLTDTYHEDETGKKFPKLRILTDKDEPITPTDFDTVEDAQEWFKKAYPGKTLET